MTTKMHQQSCHITGLLVTVTVHRFEDKPGYHDIEWPRPLTDAERQALDDSYLSSPKDDRGSKITEADRAERKAHAEWISSTILRRHHYAVSGVG